MDQNVADPHLLHSFTSFLGGGGRGGLLAWVPRAAAVGLGGGWGRWGVVWVGAGGGCGGRGLPVVGVLLAGRPARTGGVGGGEPVRLCLGWGGVRGGVRV